MSGRRVLIIDDDREAAASVAEFASWYGLTVEVATDGLSGVSRAAVHPPDVVLCDLQLPDVDGLWVARTLRNRPATRASTIVALTGLCPDLREMCELACAGFDHHIAKPPCVHELEEVLGTAEGDAAATR